MFNSNDENLDPEIAALLATEGSDDDSLSDFDDETVQPQTDLSKKQFDPIKNFFSDTPHAYFDDPTYYKTALSDENQSAQKLHVILSKFLTAKDPKDRSVFRQQITTIYWDLMQSVVKKMAAKNVAPAKKYMLRYGVVSPALFTAEQKQTFAAVIDANTSGEPVYYMDEWFRDIANGTLTLSATDEARPQRKKGSGSEELQKLKQQKSKVLGKQQNSENLLFSKEHERAMLEAELKSKIDLLCEHPPLLAISGHNSAYSELQRTFVSDINEKLRTLVKIDKEIAQLISEVLSAMEETQEIDNKIAALGEMDVSVSSADMLVELGTVRQMAKMTVGRQGNHFPIFTREYYHCLPKTTGFRENVLHMMRWVEMIDPGVFVRTHKRAANRIVPYVLLVPTYGDTGFCWEPFDRYNRITSRGRIVIPMYPKNLQIAVLTAVADLRWQTAKEKASYYWMEEGLTGQYYQWFDMQKLKGDVKDYFINDYILWMTKESEGVQRLNKEVRGIFWRHMPYPQTLKDTLKTRSLVYQELCQKDLNRAMSDGY